MQTIEMGKVSSRGQIAIPVEIRKKLGLEEGSKIFFLLEDDTLLIKRVNIQSWEELTKPLRKAAKKIKEKDVDKLIHRLRKK